VLPAGVTHGRRDASLDKVMALPAEGAFDEHTDRARATKAKVVAVSAKAVRANRAVWL